MNKKESIEASKEFLSFSHKIKVLFVKCSDCIIQDALNLFGVYFSYIDVVCSKDEAMSLFDNNRYNLIITGINLDSGNGIELVNDIRNISKDITILVISGENSQYNFSELIKLGVDGYLIRPLCIKQFSEVMDKTIEKLKNKEDIYHYKLDLEKKVEEQVEALRQKDKILQHQSKLAAMGEMIDAVAHQWKQPISIIDMKIDLLTYDYEDNYVDKKYCEDLYTSVKSQISHMQNTLDEFRSFLRPDKETKDFKISSMVKKALLLIHDDIIKYKINVDINIDENIYLNGIENEFVHLILNLISNAKDAFEDNKIKNRSLSIDTHQDEKTTVLEIKDNAGGIPLSVIDSLFDANVTTKQEGKGTGIGLYMSKQIVQKHHGDIWVENFDGGAKFIIKIIKF